MRRRKPKHMTRMSRGLYVLCLLMGVFPIYSQESVPFRAKEDVQHAISRLLQCLRSQRASCVVESISIRGVTLGVDGPSITGKPLVHQLQNDHSTQCLFWGTHCASSNNCSLLSALNNLDTSSIGPPRAYQTHWQVDVESRPQGACGDGMPFVFQLEEGYWKLAAIPFT